MDNTSSYKSIMDLVEQQKKDVKLNTKLYRYTGMIQAIDYFSQKLNREQIIDAAFDFINELLTLEKSAVFIVSKKSCRLQKFKGFEEGMAISADISNLQSLAVMHGTVLYDRAGLEKCFGAEILEKYGVTALIPLVMDASLYAFILISKKTAGEMDQDDYIISEALMRLINNALDTNKKYEDLQKSHRELDEKVFNLFAINQSSKALLSELDLAVLYKLSVDVFSELTQSSVTGFVLLDKKSGWYSLRAYKDVLFANTKINVSLECSNTAKVDSNKVIVDISDKGDREYFNSIFTEGIDALKQLKASFIIMLVKNDKVLGFVSLGKTVTGSMLKNSDFELIESLASATYIAISNANYFKQINDQKKKIHSELKKLISLNKLIKDINSALKVETLMALTMQTLQSSFDVKMGLMALYDSERKVFKLSGELKDEIKIEAISPNKSWSKLFKGGMVINDNWQAASKYFDKSFCDSLAPGDGVALVPIFVERVNLELLGVIIIFKYGKAPITDEEHMLTVETIANHIAPVLSNLMTMEEQKRFSLPNYIELFKRDLKMEIAEALEYSRKLQIIRIDVNREFTFKNDSLHDKLKSNFGKIYPITGNNIFIILDENSKIGDTNLHRLIGRENVKITYYNLGEEFTNYQDFFSLF